MTRTARLALALGCSGVGALMPMAVGALGFAKALALGPVLAVAGFMLLDPLRPLLLLVFFVPTDALANLLFRGLPLSASMALTLATLAALVFEFPREARERRLGPDDPVVRWTLAFALWCLVSTLFADHRDTALEAMGRLAGMMLLVPLIVRIVQTVAQARLMVLALVAATMFTSTVLVADSVLGVRLLSNEGAAVNAAWEGIARSAGASDYNPTTAAIMIASGTVMALALALESPQHRLFTGAAAALGLAASVLSYARSAALCILLVGLLLAWRHRARRGFPLALAALLALVVAMLPMVPETYWDRLATLTNFSSDYTLWRRLGYNLIGLDLLADNPVLGVGPANFHYHYVDQEYRYIPGRTMFARHLHNMYLGVASEMGLVGLGLFLALLGSGLRRLRRLAGRPGETIDGAFAAAVYHGALAYLLGSLFMPHQYAKFTWILAGLAGALARAMQADPVKRE
ncbi:MAG: O-antigen ligase family protein [Alphaproteobacteria bacterium]|nr:O-antigen ligase family protein [Alphaproteobacteria bacterium]